MPKVSFHYADVPPVRLKNKTGVRMFVEQIFSQESKPLRQLSCIFCSDEYLLKINQSFLQHSYYTDIITFDLSASEETSGEVYISIDRVKENALEHQVSFAQELLRVIFHGALHLCGYGDKTKSEITLMREKEDYYLNNFSDANQRST